MEIKKLHNMFNCRYNNKSNYTIRDGITIIYTPKEIYKENVLFLAHGLDKELYLKALPSVKTIMDLIQEIDIIHNYHKSNTMMFVIDLRYLDELTTKDKSLINKLDKEIHKLDDKNVIILLQDTINNDSNMNLNNFLIRFILRKSNILNIIGMKDRYSIYKYNNYILL